MSVSVVLHRFGSPPFRSANRAPHELWRKTLMTFLRLALFFSWHRSNGWDDAHPAAEGYLAPQPSHSVTAGVQRPDGEESDELFEDEVRVFIARHLAAERKEPALRQAVTVGRFLLLRFLCRHKENEGGCGSALPRHVGTNNVNGCGSPEQPAQTNEPQRNVNHKANLKGKREQNRDCPRTGAVPGFCGANRHRSMARKHPGQPQMKLGTVPSLLRNSITRRNP